uniref:CDP-diacylglycerol--inositol 3-phosphatidyltransferase n=1 Tax=Eptatretus burgeri TaxID=7764 RepID=A0A8C4PWJ9_EPTBU
MVENVFLFVPNVIGYVRLVCLLLAWFSFKSPIAFVLFYSIFAILDAVDGAVARRLSQTSAFGAFFDIFLDNLGRGLLWTGLFQVRMQLKMHALDQFCN